MNFNIDADKTLIIINDGINSILFMSYVNNVCMRNKMKNPWNIVNT